jgi:hypothetical protein
MMERYNNFDSAPEVGQKRLPTTNAMEAKPADRGLNHTVLSL